MDAAQFERLIGQLVDSNRGVNERAVEDRAAAARNADSLATAIS